MVKINGFRSSIGWLFALADGLLILTGIFLGIYFRFGGMMGSFRSKENLPLRVTVVVLIIQLGFYYFDLYHSRIIRGSVKMGVLLLGALAASFIVLTLIYYIIPSLTIGRGVLAITLCLIFALTFSWRILYSHVLKAWASKERILIIGTGELAKRIKGEILDNGYDGFEIVGFIDENRDKIGNKL